MGALPRLERHTMTLAELEADIYARLNYSDAPPTRVVTRIRRFINARYRRLLTAQGMTQLRDDTTTFSTIPGVPLVSLPPVVGRIHRIYEPVEGTKLENRNLEWMRDNELSGSVGDPEFYCPVGLRAVIQQPSVANTLFAVSLGVDSSNATVEYLRTGGIREIVTVTLTNTTPVQVGSAPDISDIYSFSLNANAVGVITLSSSGDTIAQIRPGESMSRYLGILLYPTPSDSDQFYVDFERTTDDLASATDEPLIPQDFHYLLSTGARSDEYEYLDDNRRQQTEVEWVLGLRRLLGFISNNPDYIVVPGGSDNTKFSSLGGDFPAGS
ncbi:MAG: hypothetical protein ACOYD0_11910 [Candidatus Nanopelagicales bacterium]